MQRKSGFTLIELMVVLVVIGVLGSILFSGANFIFGEQETKQAKTEVKIIQLALEEYQRDYGTYPLTDDISSNQSDNFAEYGIRMLNVMGGTHDEYGNELGENERRRSYLPLDKFSTMTSENLERYLIDPWEEPYIYSYPRQDGHDGYLLFSKGPDRKTQSFNERSDSVPKKEPEDMDNIPSSEPGKW